MKGPQGALCILHLDLQEKHLSNQPDETGIIMQSLHYTSCELQITFVLTLDFCNPVKVRISQKNCPWGILWKKSSYFRFSKEQVLTLKK